MLFAGRCLFTIIAVMSLVLLVQLKEVHAVDPRFELDTKELDSKGLPSGFPVKAKHVKGASRLHGRNADGFYRYTVKPGDHLYRILMSEYGCTEKQAEALIPSLKRINGISDIRGLKVGSSLAIPLSVSGSGGGKKSASGRAVSHVAAVSALPLQKFRLSSHMGEVNHEAVSAAEKVWESLVPFSSSSLGSERGVDFGGDNFSLSIDPDRFPTLTAQDGATIVVDSGNRLPPLVKSLLHERGEQVRFVNENPDNRKSFYSSLLDAGRFFSVAENFTVDFGKDPQLTVNSDFKVEKTPESLLRQEMVLLNVSDDRSETPQSLVYFLNRQGFQLLEPYTVKRNHALEGSHRIHRISAGKVSDIADRLFSSLDIRYSRDSMVELYGPNDSGLRLDIRADRFFEIGGARYVVSYFNGDPVFYTLMRLLETRGYKVVILEEQDDFRRVVEKIASSMGIHGSFGKHSLWPSDNLPYSVRISGYMFRNPKGGEKVFITDREIDPLISELASLNGYTVFAPKE